MGKVLVIKTLAELALALQVMEEEQQKALAQPQAPLPPKAPPMVRVADKVFSESGQYAECGACEFFHAAEFMGSCLEEAGQLTPLEIMWYDSNARIDMIDDSVVQGFASHLGGA